MFIVFSRLFCYIFQFFLEGEIEYVDPNAGDSYEMRRLNTNWMITAKSEASDSALLGPLRNRICLRFSKIIWPQLNRLSAQDIQ
jgi:hypothetical protein